jgi:NAD(P)-dependent dehydrogenase (short-subunit alcohol dehydrogenase family)
MKGLKDQHVVIVGATGTIGTAIAEVFDDEEARLFLLGLNNRDAMENMQGRLKHVDAAKMGLDLAVDKNVKELFESIPVNWEERIDSLVVSSGTNPSAAAVRDLAIEDWQKTIDVNLTLPFLCVKHALRYMGQGGSIVIIGSIFGIESPANRGAYGASKHGLLGLAQTVCREEGGKGIRINVICPGPVWGPIVYAIFQKHAQKTGISVDDYIAQRLSKIPTGRFAEGRDVAGLAAYLCSDGAKYINGQALKLTGGAVE